MHYNFQAEQNLLAYIIQDNDWLLITGAEEEDFLEVNHKKIFTYMSNCIKNTAPANKISLVSFFESLGLKGYIAELLNNQSCIIGPSETLKILRELRFKRELDDITLETKEMLSDASKNVQEIKDVISERLEAISIKTQNQSVSLGKAAKEAFSKEKVISVSSGYESIDEIINGFDLGDLIVIAGRPAMGKAQPLDSKILTTTGWKRMGDVELGDELASVDGKSSNVIAIHEQGKKEIFHISFRDGRSTECCAEHLWKVYCRKWTDAKILDTRTLISLLGQKQYKNRLWIEEFTGEFGLVNPLPIDPWVLGVLIGDGGLSGGMINFTNTSPEIIKKLQTRLGLNFSVRRQGDSINYRIAQSDSKTRQGLCGVRPNKLKESLKELGLFGCLSHEKFIPIQYLSSNREMRLELIRGLIDTDGFVEKSGTIRYGTSSKRLADDFIYLARSLGAITHVSTKRPFFKYKGEIKEGKLHYRITISHASEYDFVTLSSKKKHTSIIKSKQKRNTIQKIEKIGVKEAQCITVSHPSSLYITDDFIVTHNSCLAANMALRLAKKGNPILFISLEMKADQISKRMIACLSSIHLTKLKNNNLNSQQEFEDFQNAITLADTLPITIEDSGGLTLPKLRYQIKKFVNKTKGKVVIIDYIQLIKHKGKGQRVDDVTEITNTLKDLAMEFNIVIIGLSQLSRAVESRDDKRPILSDLRESGSIEQDASVVMFTFRPEYYLERQKPDDSARLKQWEAEMQRLKGVAYCMIAKVRDGKCGDAKLHFEGEFQRFSDW